MHLIDQNEKYLFRKENVILINIYYHSPKNGDYLHHVVDSSGVGRVKDFQNLEGLNGDQTADVVLLEYQDNNPTLDSWIAQTTAQTGFPEIFLFVEEVSPPFIWKALKLGVREIFPGAMQPEELQDAVLRLGMRQANLARQS